MSYAVISAIYGGYDTLKPLPEGVELDDAVCVTDDPELSAPGWRTVVEDQKLPPILAAKRAKCLPWLYTDCEFSLWIDGAMQLKAEPPWVATTLTGLAAFVHPTRHHWADEAEFSSTLARYAHLPLDRQVSAYRSLGVGPGLWACGFLVRRHTERVKVHGETWHTEILQWGEQDQVSFPAACEFSKVWPVTIAEGSVTHNPWTQWRGHVHAS